MFFRNIDTTLETDFKVRVVLNSEASALMSSIDGYEPLLSSISLPSPPVSFSRMGITIASSLTEPSFSFSYIPVKETMSVGKVPMNGDPLLILDKTQYSNNGLLLPLGSLYVSSVEDEFIELTPTQVEGLSSSVAMGFPIKVGFDIYNMVNHKTLYRLRNCRFTVAQASASVSGEEFAKYNVNVYSDSMTY